MKKCTRCEKTKAPDQFYLEKRTKDGLRAECRLCMTSTRGAAKRYQCSCGGTKSRGSKFCLKCPERPVMWRKDKYGYMVTSRAFGGRKRDISQHRVVMEEMLGRPLMKGENVHHINGVRHDNRPSNLELWVTWQPAGQRPADLVAWAKEILRRYDSPAP